jgi:lipocalin
MALTLLPPSQFLLSQYLGLWYQYASTKHFYEPSGSYNTTALYQLESDGTISVLNTLFTNGKENTITGTLLPTSTDPNSRVFQVKLNKAFLWIDITAPYAVQAVAIDSDGAYQFTVVGSSLDSDSGSVYILSRVQQPDCSQQQFMLKVVADLGYDGSKLRFTPQICAEMPVV